MLRSERDRRYQYRKLRSCSWWGERDNSRESLWAPDKGRSSRRNKPFKLCQHCSQGYLPIVKLLIVLTREDGGVAARKSCWKYIQEQIIPALGRHRKEDLCGTEGSLVYMASSRTVRATERDPAWKINKTEQLRKTTKIMNKSQQLLDSSPCGIAMRWRKN